MLFEFSISILQIYLRQIPEKGVGTDENSKFSCIP